MKDFIDFLKLPPNILGALSIASGALLLLPDQLAKRLYMTEFRDKYGFTIGIIFVVSTAILSMLNQYFYKIGYVVYTAINGKEALNAITKNPDIILLDINMPDMNGFTVCEAIRNYVSCPIIFLTARVEDCDKIKGFAIGADDYVVKPFSIDELEARVAAHLRREKRHSSSAIVQFDKNIVIDYSSRTVFYKNAEINFTKKEFDIIEFLSQNKGIVFDRETIYEKVWGLDGCGDNSVVRNIYDG